MASTDLRVHGKTHSQIGEPVEVRLRPFLATALGQRGMVLFGPYEVYKPGRYIARFTLALAPGFPVRSDGVCCNLDVVGRQGTLALGKACIFISDLGPEPRPFHISFEVAEPARLEFRVVANGRAPLLVGCDRVVERIRSANGRYAPVLGPEAAEPPAFFVDNLEMFRYFHASGVRFSIEDERVIAQVDGVRVAIGHREQFQILDEIFIRHEYGLVSGQQVCAIDIGMNAGFTSLYLASRPFVAEVHSYEPFADPFAQAMFNVGLNPRLSTRISLNNFGLSDFDGEQTLQVDDSETIGSSLKGHIVGPEQKIQIRDAGAALKGPIESAVRRGLDVFAKIDCEGSEFAVIDSLKQADLLRHVTAMAVEWHKWWDFEKSQQELFASLLPAGFVCFDLTQTRNLDAGFFYAVRSGDRRPAEATGRETAAAERPSLFSSWIKGRRANTSLPRRSGSRP